MRSPLATRPCQLLLHVVITPLLLHAVGSAGTKPNIVLIVVDDLGFGDVGFRSADTATGGTGDIVTPTIDALAKTGVVLSDYYVQPICSPTRTALLSGRYSYTVGAAGGVITNGRPNALPLNVSTMADNLRAGGWRCMAAGKWDLGMHAWNFTPTFRGFERFVGFYDAAEDHFTHMADHWLDLRNDTTPLRTNTGTYSTHLYTGAVVAFIREHAPPSNAPASGLALAMCLNMSLRQDWSAGDHSITVAPADDVASCCQRCAKQSTPPSSCVAFSFHQNSCYLKNTTFGSHAKTGVVSGLLHGHWPTPAPQPPRPSPPPLGPPVPAPPSPRPVPGGASAPLFLYTAYQAVHSPLQAPPEYVARCPHVLQAQRQILCGMMHAVDEGVENITQALRETRRWNSTLLVFTTDNGGTGSSAGTNWPLRGQKATMWEGGVRGIGFVSGYGLSPAVRGTTSSALLHVSDWLPTLVVGVAGLTVHSPVGAPPLDGINAWAAISQGRKSSRQVVLLNLCPEFAVLGGGQIRVGWQQSAIRHLDMKLIWGLPGDEDKAACKPPSCKNGWQRPPTLGNNSWPPPEPPEHATFSPNVWLFNLSTDLSERHNLASAQPDTVAFLQGLIRGYNASHVWQANQFNPPFDPRSDPSRFGGVWSPWLSNPPAPP